MEQVQSFIGAWWMQLLVIPALPVAWIVVKRIVKKTPTKIDDQIAEVIDEVVEDVKAGKEARNAQTIPQPVTTPELSAEERKVMDNP